MNMHTETLTPIEANNIYADPRVKDPRLIALMDMGMHERWLIIAKQIGMDHFLFMWSVLDETRTSTNIVTSIPRINRFLRYMRNKLIRELVERSTPSHIIQKRIRDELGENLTVRRIDQLKVELTDEACIRAVHPKKRAIAEEGLTVERRSDGA